MKFHIIILILLIASFTYAADFSVTLDKDEYGKQSDLSGIIDIDINDVPYDSKLIFDIDGSSYEFNMTEICSFASGSCGKKDSEFTILELLNNPEIVFDNAGTNTDYGIALYGSSIDVETSSFDIEGKQKDGSYPSSVKVDVGSDGEFDWNYIGDFLLDENNNYVIEKIPTIYLKDLEYDLKSVIWGSGKTEYCEKIEIPVTKRLRVSAYVKQYTDDDEAGKIGYLSARIRDSNMNILNNDLGYSANCFMNEPSTSWTWSSCDIEDITIKEGRDYYICVYSSPDVDEGAPSRDLIYYEIATEKNSNVNRGYKCNSVSCEYADDFDSDDFDYFIESFYFKHDMDFNVKETIDDETASLNSLMNSIDCDYSSSFDGDNYCLFPLTFVSKSEGKIELSNLDVLHDDLGEGSFSKINFVPEKVDYDENISIELDDLNLTAPSEIGDHEINVKLKYGEDVLKTHSYDLKVIDAPEITFNIPKTSFVGNEIRFNATVTGGTGPYTYSWDFGDFENSSSSSPMHTYTMGDTYTVKLTVKDSNGVSVTKEFEIEIVEIDEVLEPLLNQTDEILTTISNELKTGQGDASEIASILNLNSRLETAKNNISNLKLEYKSALSTFENRNQRLVNIYNKLKSLREEIPFNIQVNSISYNSKVSSSSIIREIGYDEDLINAQGLIDVSSKAYMVNINYLSNDTESFVLIKKDVSLLEDVEDAYIYEYIPKETTSTISEEDILTQGFEIVEEDPILRFPISGSLQISYKLYGADLNLASNVNTILVVEGYDTGFEYDVECGDGKCDPLEEDYCDIDCRRDIPWLLYIFLFLLLGGGVYYINFYKGKWNFKQLANFISVKLRKKRIFTSKQDLINLQNYIKKTLNYGMNERQIRFILEKKGWTKEQLDYVFKKINKKSKKKSLNNKKTNNKKRWFEFK